LTAAGVWNSRVAAPTDIIRFSCVLPAGQRFTNAGRHVIALSPDGTNVVYVANRQLFLRRMAEAEAKPIPGTQVPGFVTTPFFSPDGQWIGFWSDNKLNKIALTGGSAVALCDADNPFGVAWGPGDQIYVGQGSKGIIRCSTNRRSQPEVVINLKPGETAHGPQILPGGEQVLLTVANTNDADLWDKADIVVQSLKSGLRRTLMTGGSDARYVPSGHIVYAHGSTLLAIRFDLRNLQVIGSATPVLEGVARGPALQTAAAHFSFSANGRMVHIPGNLDFTERNLVLIDSAGVQKPLNVPSGSYYRPRLSPNGKLLAVAKADGGGTDIWIYDLTGVAAPRRLTFEGRNVTPLWSRDGKRIVFASDRNGSYALYWQRVDTSSTAELLTKLENGSSPLQPESWSSDGKLLWQWIV
jgi:WD40-like Beta Propeller Repeat